MPAGQNWTEDEIIQAIGLYLNIPFGRIDMRTPEIIALASKLERSPGSIALKLANLASIDETLDRKGMANASALDRETWRNYFDDLSSQAASLPATDEPAGVLAASDMGQLPIFGTSAGTSTPRIVNVRQGQQVFRQMVLNSYDRKCAITGIAQSEFLIAGHIKTWADDPANRMNPRNGICLNRLHDKAFEDGLIAIEPTGRVLYSSKLDAVTQSRMEAMNDSGRFVMPTKFKPDPEFLEEHRRHRFHP